MPYCNGFSGVLRHKGDGDAVEAEARLVHQAGREDVYFVQSADLPVRGAVIAKPGDGVPLQVGLGACVLLPGIVAREDCLSRRS